MSLLYYAPQIDFYESPFSVVAFITRCLFCIFLASLNANRAVIKREKEAERRRERGEKKKERNQINQSTCVHSQTFFASQSESMSICVCTYDRLKPTEMDDAQKLVKFTLKLI